MVFNPMNKRGQIAIEFILVLVILLAFLQFVIQPALNSGETALQDVKRVGEAKNAALRFVQTLNALEGSFDGSVMNITIFLPEKSRITCEENNQRVVWQADLNQNSGACTASNENVSDNDDLKCTQFISTTANFSCVPETFEAAEISQAFRLRLPKRMV